MEITLGVSGVFSLFYRTDMLSFIKEVLARGDEGYKRFLYSSKRPKPFTFSVEVGKFKLVSARIELAKGVYVNNKVFELSKPTVKLLVSSPDERFSDVFMRGVYSVPGKPVETTRMVLSVKSVTLLGESEIRNDVALFKTLSPVIVSKGGMERLSEYSTDLMDKKLFALRGRGLSRKLGVNLVSFRTLTVKHTLRGVRSDTGLRYGRFNAVEGLIEIKGDTEDLRYIYLAGFLNRTSQGFGMLSVVEN